MTSAFAHLPAAVLSEILRLTLFVDTLRCEQVCRSWRKVLKSSTAATGKLHPTWSPGIWGQELQLVVATPEDDWAEPTLEHAQTADTGSIVITLLASTNDSAHFYEIFLIWLTKHAVDFLKILIFKSATQSSWLFAHIVEAIGTASLSAPPLFAVRLIAVFGVLQSPSFCKLLGAVIISWSSIHSIAAPAELQPLTSLTGLTHLCVFGGTNLET